MLIEALVIVLIGGVSIMIGMYYLQNWISKKQTTKILGKGGK